MPAVTPSRAVISGNTNGDNTVVAAVTGKKIAAYALVLTAAAAVNVRFESGAGGTALTGVMTLAQGVPLVLPLGPAAWFETAAGALLNMELSAGVQVSGAVLYLAEG